MDVGGTCFESFEDMDVVICGGGSGVLLAGTVDTVAGV